MKTFLAEQPNLIGYKSTAVSPAGVRRASHPPHPSPTRDGCAVRSQVCRSGFWGIGREPWGLQYLVGGIALTVYSALFGSSGQNPGRSHIALCPNSVLMQEDGLIEFSRKRRLVFFATSFPAGESLLQTIEVYVVHRGDVQRHHLREEQSPTTAKPRPRRDSAPAPTPIAIGNVLSRETWDVRETVRKTYVTFTY